ncbi:cholesterol 24-hydroxylase [Lingula anatina]|uniref:Cholesterol 24-hydroxylase n=2 Tax=Lingula anatina TaxID=7574 RepID=A0A1S3IT20_LINAN|nr:cholesterol 24-hydroxylase [Lingula anatina]XP_013401361.1 cholesterol 24-hydroxylase [Lingula anatina]XP_013401362.1 cholesterol 24-hydroxylase [Lingula anatina]XP_013401363.1 cholesterol 24-hydroxylase [Lingula anatina]|eukprot:XP_013401360.1 cholesterol 24-hydroxylase [Lingula anatina]
MERWVIGQMVVAIAFISIVAYLLFIQWVRKVKFGHVPCPKFKGISSLILGHTAEVVQTVKNGGKFHNLLQNWLETYGNTIVFHAFHKAAIMTADPRAIKDVFVNGGLPRWPQSFQALLSVYGERYIGKSGLVTIEHHAEWSKMRALMNPAFQRVALMSLIDQFNLAADSLMEKLSELADGKTMVDMNDMFCRLTLDVIGKVAFDTEIESVHNDTVPFPKAVKTVLEGIEKMFTGMMEEYNIFHYSYHQEVRQAVRLLREEGRKFIEKRKMAMSKGEHSPNDILSYIIKASELDPDLDIEDMLDLVMVFFLAGHETTGNTLSFALRVIADHPDVMQRLEEEVESAVGQKAAVSFEDLKNLKYMGNVFKESLRLYPVAGLTLRQLNKDMMVGDYLLPAGTGIGVHVYSCGRMAQFHQEADKFIPDRFDPDSPMKPNAYSYLPFSIGPRNCIGQNFAKMEMKIIMAKFIQRFKFEVDRSSPLEILEEATLKPKGGVWCTLKLRD